MDVATVIMTLAVIATVYVLLMDVRPPKTSEAAAFLVLVGVSYLVSPELPPVLALLFSAWLVKTYFTVSREPFSVNAIVHEGPAYRGPTGYDPMDEPDAPAPKKAPRSYETTLATPEALFAAQSALVPRGI